MEYYLSLDQEGSIEGTNDKTIYVSQGSLVRLCIANAKQGQHPIVILGKKKSKLKHYFFIDSPVGTTLKTITEAHETQEFKLDESGDWILDINFNTSGASYFRVLWIKGADVAVFGVPNYILVQPPTVKQLQQITIQTVLPHCMGKFADYEAGLRSQVALGYGAFHLPPIQQLGQSPSLYAIADQMNLNKDIFQDAKLADLKALFDRFPGVLFFIDILLNHTAFDSPWLLKPEFTHATYNSQNSPHLECAIQLDCTIADFSNQIAEGKVKDFPKKYIENQDDLNNLMNILEHQYIEPLKLYEYFMYKVEEVTEQILKKCPLLVKTRADEQEEDANIFIKSPQEKIISFLKENTVNQGAKRFGATLNIEAIGEFLNTDKNYLKLSCEYIVQALHQINLEYQQTAQGYLREALNATRGQINWYKIEQKDPEVKLTEKGDSLLPRYFTKLANRYVANNGWIQNFDPLNNFAEGHEHHYFRRTIVVWGDLVKLRYGKSKADCPALWKYMKKYVQDMSRTFHGLRLDNAHSTPLHVGEHMMRKARKVDPKILVFAELFTGSSEIDSIFTKRFGFNCLVRETNRSHDSGQLNRELHYYNGDGLHSIGSLPPLDLFFNKLDENYIQLRPQYPPALVYEQSHDNETLISSHGFKHQLPIAALIAFSNCMGGTVRGYDQYIQHRLSVVDERRLYHVGHTRVDEHIHKTLPVTFRLDWKPHCRVEVYGSWNQWKEGIELDEHKANYWTTLQLNEGVYEYKYQVEGEWLNMIDKDYNENGNHTITVKEEVQKVYRTMEQARLHLNNMKKSIDYPYIFEQSYNKSVQSITRTNNLDSKILIACLSFGDADQFTTVELPGRITKVDFIMYNGDDITFENDKKQILASEVSVYQHTNILKYADIYVNHQTKNHVLKFTKIPTSFVALISCTYDDVSKKAIDDLDSILKQRQDDHYKGLTSAQLNYLLFVSEPEAREISNSALYDLPNYRPLIYAGFMGALSPVREAEKWNQLSHPICDNLRTGNWLIDYLNDRLHHLQHQVKKHINEIFNSLKQLPRHLIPSYFCKIVEMVIHYCYKTMNSTMASRFRRELSLASYQFLAVMPQSPVTMMSAGLPHFTTGWARCWGRDTFISFKGLFLLNGLYQEAKDSILIFASCLRHGLMPNLLDSRNNPRYNCRDACWWYIKAVGDYIQYTGDAAILKQSVEMVFTDDDMETHYRQKDNKVHKTVEDIVQTIFQQHASGIKYREWRAGGDIDHHMNSEGFNIHLHMDEETGFIVGGNWRNCLTWMDKMGSSSEAENKGIPATSRDGAPIEMTALLKVCLDIVQKLHAKKQYQYSGVQVRGKTLEFKDWISTITKNFEKYYWVPKVGEAGEFKISEQNVRHRQIYKDHSHSSKPRNEYQLRCNASIAIGLAPDLFTKERAMYHLAATEASLIQKKSIGLKTLDPQASEYVHFYDNSDQSKTFNVAHGFSYHNGPEWVWVYGYFMKALVAIHGKEGLSKQLFYSYLSNHKEILHHNEWYSLPEMTNGNGEYNHFSCRAQAWSIACILEAVDDFEGPVQK